MTADADGRAAPTLRFVASTPNPIDDLGQIGRRPNGGFCYIQTLRKPLANGLNWVDSGRARVFRKGPTEFFAGTRAANESRERGGLRPSRQKYTERRKLVATAQRISLLDW